MFGVVLRHAVPCASSQKLSTKGQQSSNWEEEDDEEHEEGRVVVLNGDVDDTDERDDGWK